MSIRFFEHSVSVCGSFMEKRHKKLEVSLLFYLNAYRFSGVSLADGSLRAKATAKRTRDLDDLAGDEGYTT